MDFSKKALGCAIALTLALTSTFAQAWEKDKTYNITILHTNDHHGRFWQNDAGEYGLAAQKTAVDAIRREVQRKGGRDRKSVV